MTDQPQPAAGTGRFRWATVLLGLLGGGITVAAATRPWATQSVAGLPAAGAVHVTGSSAVPQVTALALVALASAVVLATAGPVVRMVAALLLVLVGLGLPAAIIPAAGGHGSTSSFNGWAWVAVAGGAAILAAGGLGLVHSRAWPGPARKYERDDRQDDHRDTLAASGTAPDAWTSLSRGEDPT